MVDDIEVALNSGDVKELNERWYTKVSETHISMFVLIEKLGQLLESVGDEHQRKQFKKLLKHESTLTGLDCYCSTTGVSYTDIIDDVRREFGGMARTVEILMNVAIARGQVEIVQVLNAIHEVSCAEANADCFKSLLNGYQKRMAMKCDDSP